MTGPHQSALPFRTFKAKLAESRLTASKASSAYNHTGLGTAARLFSDAGGLQARCPSLGTTSEAHRSFIILRQLSLRDESAVGSFLAQAEALVAAHAHAPAQSELLTVDVLVSNKDRRDVALATRTCTRTSAQRAAFLPAGLLSDLPEGAIESDRLGIYQDAGFAQYGSFF